MDNQHYRSDKQYFDSDTHPENFLGFTSMYLRKNEEYITKPLKPAPISGLTKAQRKKRAAADRAKQIKKRDK